VSYTPVNKTINTSLLRQFIAVLIIGSLVYLVIPLLGSFAEASSDTDTLLLSIARTIARAIVNYTFVGSLLIVVVLRWPFTAFQVAIVLTVCHTVMDLADDLGKGNTRLVSPLVQAAIALASSLIISLLVFIYQRKQNVLKSMFLLLVWSTVAVAITRMMLFSQFSKHDADPVLKFIIGDMLVFNVFVVSAIIVSVLVVKRVYQRLTDRPLSNQNHGAFK
jgi:hypothetical protein